MPINFRQRGRSIITAQTVDLPAPVGGWNARDGWAVMQPQYAITLDNFFPDMDGLRLRQGSRSWATTITGTVGTLYSYDTGIVSKLLAFDDTKIWDVTAGGAATSIGTGFSTNIWSCTTFGTAPIYCLMFNGTDTPQKWDGTTLSNNVITGPSNPIGCHAHKNRLFIWDASTTAFYYGGLNAISGAFSKFELAGVYRTEGHIVGMGTWTFDGGNGPDDTLAVFLSSGQVFIYSGTDPGGTGTWSIVGVFYIDEPLSARSITNFGSDVMIGTKSGYFPLSKALSLGKVTDAVSISSTINHAVKQAYAAATASTGWQAILYSNGSMIIFNVPSGSDAAGNALYYQHVMNTKTGAWCRFTGMNGSCWAVHSGILYFGGVNNVYQADYGYDDLGTAITGTAIQAYSNMGVEARNKRWTMARPIFSTDGSLPVSMGLGIDYGAPPALSPVSSVASAGELWATAGSPSANSGWDNASWAAASAIQKQWQSLQGIGQTASLSLSASTATQPVKWYATTFAFEAGGVI